MYSNIDLMWNEQQAAEAEAEGWQLAWVVNSGMPIQTAVLDVFDTTGTTFTTKAAAMRHVIAKAQNRSKLHLDALAAISASRASASAGKGKR